MESNWKKNCSDQMQEHMHPEAGQQKQKRNPVGGMIGVYIISYSEGKVVMENVIRKSTFIPMLSLVYDFTLNDPVDPKGIIIMPSTYEVSVSLIWLRFLGKIKGKVYPCS